MRIAHISDTHLGFRAFYRQHESGMNQREFDVLESFKAGLDQILAYDPDLVIHSGDLFHVVRPSNHSIEKGFQLLREFQAGRLYAPFVLVGGNHDTPKSSDSGNVQNLIAQIPGVKFAATKIESITFSDIETCVHCVPSWGLHNQEWQNPIRREYCNLLSLHGMASQAIPDHAAFDVDHLQADTFDYVALGDYHMFSQYAPNCCYSGATDFTSSNIWEEAGRPKGWVSYDTDTKALDFHPIPTRRVVDLPIIDARDLTVDEVRALLVQDFGPDMPIVRQRITNIHPSDRRLLLRTGILKDLNAQCLNYQIATTAPDKSSVAVAGVTLQSDSLESLYREHCQSASLPAAVELDNVIELGLGCLKEVA